MNKDLNRVLIANAPVLNELIRSISYLECKLTKLNKYIYEQTRPNSNPKNGYGPNCHNFNCETMKRLLEHALSNRKAALDKLLEKIENHIRSSIQDPEELAKEFAAIRAELATLSQAYDDRFSNYKFHDDGSEDI